MSKKYLEIGEHGLNGDFYTYDGGPLYRADNLAIATRIAVNDWLREFDNIGHDCTLFKIYETDGTFTMLVDSIGIQTILVKYYGPADMFQADTIHNKCSEKWYTERYADMEQMNDNNDPRVRRSNRSGLVMFNVHFPRYRKNGDWWDHENTYLSTNRDLANEQWQFVMSKEGL